MAGGTTEQRQPVDHVERLPLSFLIAVATLIALAVIGVAVIAWPRWHIDFQLLPD